MMHSINGLGGRRLVVKCVVDDFPEMLQGNSSRGDPFLLFNCWRNANWGVITGPAESECFGKGSTPPFWKFKITIQREKKCFQLLGPQKEEEAEEWNEEKTVISIRIRGVIIILFTPNRGDLSLGLTADLSFKASSSSSSPSSLSLPGINSL